MNTTPERDTAGGLVSLRALGAAVRRHRKLLAACAVVGALIGASVHVAVPRRVTATEDLYLAQAPGTNTQIEVADDQSVLQTWAVANRVVQRLHLPMSPSKFLKSYSSTAVSTAVISVSLSAPNPQLAVTREEALAQIFLAFRAHRYTQQVDAEVANLQSQATTLQKQIAHLTASVPATSVGGSSGKIANIVNQENSDTASLASLDAQVQQAELGLRALVAGSAILDPAVVNGPSAARVWAEDGLAGLGGGLGLALLGVLVAASLSDGLVWRDDVAAVLGAPVGASVDARASRLLGRRAARVGWRRRAAYRQSTAYLRAQLKRPDTTLSIVPVGSRRTTAAAAAVARQLVDSYLLEGQRVGVVDRTDGQVLAKALHLRSGREAHRRCGTLVLLPDRSGAAADGAPPEPAHDIRVQFLEVDPSAGSEQLSPFASPAVVVLKAGAVDAVRLEAAALLLGRAGYPIAGAVLLDADARDATTGALRRRSAGDERPGRLAVVGSDR